VYDFTFYFLFFNGQQILLWDCRTYGIFHLSDRADVNVIKQCQQRGFHPHEEPPDGSRYMNIVLMFI